jgi:hypothetical protein
MTTFEWLLLGVLGTAAVVHEIVAIKRNRREREQAQTMINEWRARRAL